MAISTSAVTKIGAAGAVTTTGGLAGTYFAWDHITLYAVEREVLEKDLQFTVSEPENTSDPKIVTISAPNHEDSNKESTLSKDYSWSCKITVVDSTDSAENSLKDLASRIRDNLPTSEAKVKYWDKHKKDKARALLVRACSKVRDPKATQKTSSVTGTLTLKKDGGNNFKFVDHSELDDFVNSDLKMVEREVIEKDVKLKAAEDKGKTKLTVTPEQSGSPALTSSYSWTCEINLDPKGTDIVSKLQNNLHKSGSDLTKEQKINKELLVRACSKKREETPAATYAVVKGLLTVKEEGGKKVFENHPEINHLLEDPSSAN